MKPKTDIKTIYIRILQMQLIQNENMLQHHTFAKKIMNVNNYNENNGNFFTQLAKTVRHVMTVHVTNP